MTKVLVTGSDGQLGQSIRQRSSLNQGLFFDFTDIGQLDITDKKHLREYFAKSKPDVVINCAAYTAVDKAEEEPEKAFLINADAVENLAQAAFENNILLIHISTDFVFDGKSKTPYTEADLAHPISIYAKSKLAGEEAMVKCRPNGMIFRTSWLYSEYGHNFVKTILRLASERPEIKVVSDQIGTPTYAGDLASVILKILALKYRPDGVQLFHYSNEGQASWFDFAAEIIKVKKLSCVVNPVSTDDYPHVAMRPKYSVMSKDKFRQVFSIEIPAWKESLRICLANL